MTLIAQIVNFIILVAVAFAAVYFIVRILFREFHKQSKAAAIFTPLAPLRVGLGYDVHRLVTGRPLILGGVNVPFDRGLEGHSDADVLVHAVMDALLGASGQGDIGRHFPDHDPRYAGISSLVLLEQVGRLLAERGYRVNNVDAVVVAQAPRLAAYIPSMEFNIARSLNIDAGRINVKATTTEGLGFTGTGEGIAAYAVAAVVSS